MSDAVKFGFELGRALRQKSAAGLGDFAGWAGKTVGKMVGSAPKPPARAAFTPKFMPKTFDEAQKAMYAAHKKYTSMINTAQPRDVQLANEEYHRLRRITDQLRDSAPTPTPTAPATPAPVSPTPRATPATPKPPMAAPTPARTPTPMPARPTPAAPPMAPPAGAKPPAAGMGMDDLTLDPDIINGQ